MAKVFCWLFFYMLSLLFAVITLAMKIWRQRVDVKSWQCCSVISGMNCIFLSSALLNHKVYVASRKMKIENSISFDGSVPQTQHLKHSLVCFRPSLINCSSWNFQRSWMNCYDDSTMFTLFISRLRNAFYIR